MPLQRVRHIFSGQVQGVGFRPCIYQLAKKYNLVGSVKNTLDGVTLEIQGEAHVLSSFIHELFVSLPSFARIDSHHQQELSINTSEDSFCIVTSSHDGICEGNNIFLSPDIGICKECINDIEKDSRRKGYAFTNCTNCGPRYSVTRAVPYDRENTSMACFPLCAHCLAEYENPEERRFHAQPTACSHCGPMVWFTQESKYSLSDEALSLGEKAIASAAQCLYNGDIIALKGLGGFQLVCDASKTESVARLRYKKNRPDKPLAIMTDSLSSAKKIVHINSIAEKWLVSSEKPITLCPINRTTNSSLSPLIAPMMQYIGVMLPYTPLHYLLLQEFAKIQRLHGKHVPALVMTSGNNKGEPIAMGNREALVALEHIAEGWLFHNRDIIMRIDDSVVLPLDEDSRLYPYLPDTLFLRRARGFVPRPLASMASKTSICAPRCLDTGQYSPVMQDKETTSQEKEHSCSSQNRRPIIMGVGADDKNTFCYIKGSHAFVSQHIGTMHNIETEAFYLSAQKHLSTLLSVSPEYIVRDLHPNYAVNRIVEHLGLPSMELQHHAAHAFSILGENLFEGKALVLALDGTGLGDDGELWGGEALIADMRDGCWSRAGHLSRIPLPGGDIAVKEPWRIAHALMLECGMSYKNQPWLPDYASFVEHIPLMLEKKINTPYSSSCGRLFDAVSALLGVCLVSTYEGQAAMLLEQSQWGDREYPSPTAFSLLPEEVVYLMPIIREEDRFVLSSRYMIEEICKEKEKGVSPFQLARKFHQSLAFGLCELSEKICKKYHVEHVGLSGGVMQNKTLLSLLCKGLKKRGMIPLTHKQLPAGDGGISFGQAVWGAITLRAGGVTL